MLKQKVSKIVSFIIRLIKRCSEHRVSRSAAELTYYILFTIFPLIVFLYSVVSLLGLSIEEILDRFLPMMPTDIYELILDYLSYVGGMSRRFMLYAGSVLAVYMLFKAITSLNYAVRRAFGVEQMKSRTRIIMSLITSCVIMVVIMFFLILFGVSRNIYHYIALFFELNGWVSITADVIRYAAGPVFLFFALTFYYHIMDDRGMPIKRSMPGALVAVFMWYSFSIAFMLYVNHYGKYTNLYGSLASIMVLMIWLHTTGTSFIIGAEINAMLKERR